MHRPGIVRRPIIASSAATLAVALALAVVAPAWAAGRPEWVPAGPPGAPAVTALAVGQSDYVLIAPRPSLLFAATAADVLLSRDDGESWVSAGTALGSSPVALAVRQVFHLGVDTGTYDTIVFAGTSNGVYRLIPGGTAWVSSNAGLTSLGVRALAVSGNGVVRDSSVVSVFAGTGGGLFVSGDNGASWVSRTAGLPSGTDAAITALASDRSSASTLYAGTNVGLFQSADGGMTWSKLDVSPRFQFAVSTIAVDPLDSSRVFAAGIANPVCFPLCLMPSFPVSARSLDGGATWETIDSLDGHLVTAFAATPNLPPIVFAATGDAGVFESTDGGDSWSAMNDGLTVPTVTSLAIDATFSSNLFAGTSRGAFRAPLTQTPVTCVSDGSTLCLASQRFAVSVQWSDAGNSGRGEAIPISDNAGAFWFFSPNNVELAVKVIDGTVLNGDFWVFYGALSNVEYTIRVRDTLTGAVRTYFNPQGTLASGADTSAFASGAETFAKVAITRSPTPGAPSSNYSTH